jgi:nucleoid-associated protein YgaU
MRFISIARPLVAIALAISASPVAAQTVPAVPGAAVPAAPAPAEAAIAAAVTEHAQVGLPATFSYANRPIIQLRAVFLGRGPAERVLAGHVVLDRIVEEGVTGPVTTRQIDTLITISVGGHYVSRSCRRTSIRWRVRRRRRPPPWPRLGCRPH